MSRDVGVFMQWCAEHDIEIDPRLEIRVAPEDDSWSIWCKEDSSVEIGEYLVRIPKSSIFSHKTCSCARDIVADHPPSLGLSLALLIESSLKLASPWFGYLQSLPSGIEGIALFWGLDGDNDGIEAGKWLKGTQAEKILYPPVGSPLLERVNLFYENTARPILQQMAIKSTHQDFYRAYSIVSSRAFLVDAYLGLSLVPVADIFNHIEDHHVHLESDYHVCAVCGSLEECGHDIEKADQESSMPVHNMLDTCEMVANMTISPGEEVFNVYEKGLTNAQLLSNYGFALGGNENNIVTWSVEELLNGIHAKPVSILALWRELLGRWPIAEEWDESRLVYNAKDKPDFIVNRRSAASLDRHLNLNADGQISHALWLLLFTVVVTLKDVDIGTFDAICTAARQVCQAQVQNEAHLDDPGPSASNSNGRGNSHLLRHIADLVVQICHLKMRSVYLPDMSDAQVGELLDELPANYQLTRLAVSYALEERRLVEACRGGWLEFAEAVAQERGSVNQAV